MVIRFRKIFQVSVLFLLSVNTSAQTSSSSPYSRYGIGDLQFNGFTKNMGMGGVSLGYSPVYNLNITNPASNSSLSLTTFETAVIMNQAELKNETKKQNINNVSLSYFAFGFPIINKKWGTTFGLLPYSNVGYSINDLQTNNDGASELHTYQSSGGLNQFFIGNGFSPVKNFSVGFNASYLFGVINRERRIEYPFQSNYFNTRIAQEVSTGGFYFNIGMQMTFDSLRLVPSDSIRLLNRKLEIISDSIDLAKNALAKSGEDQKGNWELLINKLNQEYISNDSIKMMVKDKKDKSNWSLTLGIVGSPSSSLSSKYSNLTDTYLYNAFNSIIVRDTIVNEENIRGDLVMPFNLGFGIMLKKGNQWLIGSDISYQNWQDYTLFGESDSLGNSWRISVGMQYHPKPDVSDIMDKKISYFQKIQYRWGFHYSQTYLQLRGHQLNDYGFSVGIGLPVKRSAAMLHVAAEVGKRGTTLYNLIEETYLKLSVGFTFNDRWFIRKPID